MRNTREQSEQTQRAMLDAAGRAFREHGYGGVGVDGLAKSANVTSGAFYSHFRSKAAAFCTVASAGLVRLRRGIEGFQHRFGDQWFVPFVTYYLGRDHRRDVAGGCAMPSLSPDVGRAEDATRADYAIELARVAEIVAAKLPGAPDRQAAWPILAQLAGGVMLARAVQDEELAQEIADAVLDAVSKAHGPAEGR